MRMILWKLETAAIFWLRIEKTNKNKNGLVVGLYETQASSEPVVAVWFLENSVGLRFAEGNLASQAEARRMQLALTYANAIAANRRKYEKVLEQGGLAERFPAGTKGEIKPLYLTAKKLTRAGWEPGFVVEVIETMVTVSGNELLLVCCPNDRLYIAVEEFVKCDRHE